jgi:hypothetical protein
MRISDELAAFLESGLAIVAATRDAELQPNCAPAWAVRVHADRVHLTAFLYKTAAQEMLRNLESHPEIALDFDRPTSHRACQVKGIYLSARSAKAAERPTVEQQAEAFAADLDDIGVPRALTAGWEIWPCTALKLRVTELYEQTPGPGAGEPLR